MELSLLLKFLHNLDLVKLVVFMDDLFSLTKTQWEFSLCHKVAVYR